MDVRVVGRFGGKVKMSDAICNVAAIDIAHAVLSVFKLKI
jgi:hypothetical protein